ncbi:MAG: ATP-binding protein [Rhodobacteraceae bacterium]|nr:ATP-binding protein [Paracoccaceae bacterium]
MRWFIGLSVIIVVVILWASNSYLTARFTETLRNQAVLRAALYSGNIKSVLQKHSVVPLLLSQDPILSAALQAENFSTTSQRLISFSDEIGAASVFLLDLNGRVVAGSDRRTIGEFLKDEEFFIRALRDTGTVFSATSRDETAYRFYFAQKVESGADTLGVIVVEVDLRKQEELWRNIGLQVALTDSVGEILLASDVFWRRQTLQDILAETSLPSRSQRVFDVFQQTPTSDFVYINGQRLFASEAAVGFRGWKVNYYASTQNVAARVNAILALEVMALALLVALMFFVLSRRTAMESIKVIRESAELRSLNARLSSEVEQRQAAEKNLQSAEQNLEQASKLAALGQMSAAVSHELNQPLAAMRTYLAGAKLLLSRNRIEEASTSFQRIDDLIERMGAITKQLKSYARKSGDDPKKIDLRNCVEAAFGMMSPQLGRREVTITQDIPDKPVYVVSDALRVEQIIINLLRNALDAVKDVTEPRISVTLSADFDVCLRIQDNGHGFDDPEALFEPFYTTKEPGEGVGLGLAISAGIATEMGGRLIARNATPLGAIFELHLPNAGKIKEATE